MSVNRTYRLNAALFSLLILLTLWPCSVFSMGDSSQRGVVMFFHENKIVLKTHNTNLEEIAAAIENLTGIKIVVDDILLYKRITIDTTKKDIEGLIYTIVRKIPMARYTKIVSDDEKKTLQQFIIFQKAKGADEIEKEYLSIKRGLQNAFVAKHKALKVSGKLSISGIFKLNGTTVYKLPRDMGKFAKHFLDENKELLSIKHVNLKVKRYGDDYINFGQYYKDIVVDNLRSHSLQIRYLTKEDGHYIMIANNTIPNMLEISVQPKITKSEAIGLVVDEIRKLKKNSKLYLKEEVMPESIELKILPWLDIETDTIIERFKTMSLYWSVKIDFYSYFVDAKTGKVYKDKSL